MAEQPADGSDCGRLLLMFTDISSADIHAFKIQDVTVHKADRAESPTLFVYDSPPGGKCLNECVVRGMKMCLKVQQPARSSWSQQKCGSLW